MRAEKLYSTAELAERFSVTVDWVRRTFGRRRGVIRLGTRHLRIPESVVEEFLRANEALGKLDDVKRNSNLPAAS